MIKLIVDFKIIDIDCDTNGDVYIAEVTTKHWTEMKPIDTRDIGFFKKLLSPLAEVCLDEHTFTAKAFKSNGKWVWETGDDASELDGHETVYWGLLRLKKKKDDETPPLIIPVAPDETRSV